MNINQGMTIPLVLQEFSGVEFFAPQPYKIYKFTRIYLTDPSISPSVPVAEDRRKGLSPIQLVAGHGNWHEHGLQDSEVHLVFVARRHKLVDGMSEAPLLENLCILKALLGSRCEW